METIYVFVRQDIPVPEQVVEALHVVEKLGMADEGRADIDAPNIILLGVPDKARMEKAMNRCREAQVQFVAWSDPDKQGDGTPTTIATFPVEKQNALKSYRLWQPISTKSLETTAPSATQT